MSAALQRKLDKFVERLKILHNDLLVAGCRRFGVEEGLSWWLSWKSREGMHRQPFIDAIRNYMKERK